MRLIKGLMWDVAGELKNCNFDSGGIRWPLSLSCASFVDRSTAAPAANPARVCCSTAMPIPPYMENSIHIYGGNAYLALSPCPRGPGFEKSLATAGTFASVCVEE
jgi:hypothetical protein